MAMRNIKTCIQAQGCNQDTQPDIARDITNSLTSEARYRILADYSPDWEYWLGVDGRFLYVSPACEAICGHPPAAFLEDPELFCHLLHPDDHAAWRHHLDHAGGDHAAHANLTLRLFDPHGNQVWLEHQCTPVFDQEGRYQGRRGVNRDITARMHAEAETRHVSQLLKVLSEVNQLISREQDESALIDSICRVAVEVGGLVASQVAFVDEISGQLMPIAASGAPVQPPDGDWPRLSAGKLVRSDNSSQRLETPQICRPSQPLSELDTWCESLHTQGIGGVIHYPLQHVDHHFGLISFFADSTALLREDVCALLKEIAGDLAYALHSFQHRRQEFEARFKLADREAHLLTLMQTLPMGIGVVVTREFVEVNQGVCNMLGYAAEELIGQPTRMVYPDDAEYERVGHLKYADIHATGTGRIETRWRRKDGRIIDVQLISSAFDRLDLAKGVVFTAEDISERKHAEERLEFLSHYDPLTRLPNRDLLRDRLQHGIQRQQRDGKQLAVLLIDLDRFKHINETLGHRVGDALLQALAARLREHMRSADTLARVGGDEFVLLLESDVSLLAISTFARKVLTMLSEPVLFDDIPLCVTASIGISLFPADGETPDDLLQHADVALYKAKDQGRNGFQFFEAEMTTNAFEHLLLESALRVAVSHNELRVHYQPQVNLANGELCGVEALVRWQHPELGLIPPGRFIPMAEEVGLIGMVGEWVLRESCRQMIAWEARGFHMPRVSVNLSVQQINRDTLLPMVAGILLESGLSSDRLELEVTESMIMRQTEMARGVLEDLRELGVKLAIDDFGTGYSSLAYLNNMPMHRLKIDQSFVRDIGRDKNADAIVRAIIALARSLGLETVAEGVEEQSQAHFLARELCDVCQGFLFSRPVEADEIHARWSVQGSKSQQQV
jgi:diguanylate cyclase (GGDEF)-like protein/PAS domain S-box-containing protein